jgi:hypothetical protein
VLPQHLLQEIYWVICWVVYLYSSHDLLLWATVSMYPSNSAFYLPAVCSYSPCLSSCPSCKLEMF